MTEPLDLDRMREELKHADETGQREWALDYGDALLDRLEAAEAKAARFDALVLDLDLDQHGQAARAALLRDENLRLAGELEAEEREHAKSLDIMEAALDRRDEVSRLLAAETARVAELTAAVARGEEWAAAVEAWPATRLMDRLIAPTMREVATQVRAALKGDS